MSLKPPEAVTPREISLAAAQIDRRRMDALREQDIDPASATALDCQPELSSVSRYGELVSADDGKVLRVDADLFGRGRALTDQSTLLDTYIGLADHQFRRGCLPSGYTLQRLTRSELPSPLPRLFFSSLPFCAAFCLALLVGYLLICEPAGLPMLTPTQAFGGAAILALALTVTVTIIRRIIHAALLWRLR